MTHETCCMMPFRLVLASDLADLFKERSMIRDDMDGQTTRIFLRVGALDLADRSPKFGRASVQLSTMFGLFTPKHQRRVNDVYPYNPGEVGAVQAKLSRLTYYVNSRPKKLKKVFAYLEKNVRADLEAERNG